MYIYVHTKTYVTEFAKSDLMGTNTEIHFLPVDEVTLMHYPETPTT